MKHLVGKANILLRLILLICLSFVGQSYATTAVAYDHGTYAFQPATEDRNNDGLINPSGCCSKSSARDSQDQAQAGSFFALAAGFYVPNRGTELFSQRPTSFDPMDEAQFSRIQEAFARQGKTIDNSEDALRYLETRGADGVTFNAETILVRPNSSSSTVFEELIHATQHRTGKFDQWASQYGNSAAVAKAEYEAASRLVRNQKAYGISGAEHSINVSRVEEFGNQLKQMGVPLD